MGTKPDGSVLFYAGLKSDDPAVRQSLVEATSAGDRVIWFHSNFKGWSDRWEVLFSKAVSAIWRPLLVCPMDQHWPSMQNVTLIGDATHVMPPYAGEGVNMAMLDALVLSTFLLSENEPGGAIAAYETEIFSRMQSVTMDTMSNTEMFYAPDACERVVALFRRFSEVQESSPVSEA